jgi:hypothetical protein
MSLGWKAKNRGNLILYWQPSQNRVKAVSVTAPSFSTQRFARGPAMKGKSLFVFIYFWLVAIVYAQPVGAPVTETLLSRNFVPTSAQIAARGPLRLSQSNPRYFADNSGRTILLAGSHTWSNLQDNGNQNPPTPFNYTAFLDFLVMHGHNFFRLWTWEQGRWDVVGTEDQNWFAPPIFQRTGPGLALDGLPKYNLTKFNQVYFDRMRDRVKQAQERGIYVSIMLFNGFSVVKQKGSSLPNGKNPWMGHPLNAANNINGVNGDLNGDNSGEETHELAVPAVTTLQKAYIRKVVDTVNNFDNVLYEISNESHSSSREWQYHMVRYIRNYEATKVKRHPIGMTVEWPDGKNSELFASPADWISPNGDVAARPIADGTKVIVADTDHLCGVCGDRSWVWRSVTAGENPILMDPYDRSTFVSGPADVDTNSPELVGARRNLGYAIQLSRRMDLGRALPQPTLASSGYCLADTSMPNPSYLVYLGGRQTVTVDLSGLSSTTILKAEWLNTKTGQIVADGSATGGAPRSFTAPGADYLVLFLHSANLNTATEPSDGI